MIKLKTQFSCQSCGTTSPKWLGRCPSCQEWNTFVEEKIPVKSSNLERNATYGKSSALPVTEIDDLQFKRTASRDGEFDRVIGGGLVDGSLTLIGGDPGIGKSTLLLKLVMNWPGKTLYVSGEESSQQIKLRANRLGALNAQTYILSETNLEKILLTVDELHPSLIVIDSIQTVYTDVLDSAPGTVSQVRECTSMLQRRTKGTHIPVILVGHITKEGELAGPKVLEHMVDTVLQFEGDQNHVFRLLRCLKNRFGSTEEMGIYEMSHGGLSPVSNPSRLLLFTANIQASGNAVGATLAGQRPILIETQALVSSAVYGTPQRSTTGFDLRRLHMLLAVLEKRCGLFYGHSDVFLNIAGGIKVTDPAIDLSVIAALISSLENSVIPHGLCFAGEVGLSGEIRSVNRLEQRILEAERLGFTKIFLSSYHARNLDFKPKTIEMVPVTDIGKLYESMYV